MIGVRAWRQRRRIHRTAATKAAQWAIDREQQAEALRELAEVRDAAWKPAKPPVCNECGYTFGTPVLTLEQRACSHRDFSRKEEVA